MIPPIGLLLYLWMADPADDTLPVPPSNDPKQYRVWFAHQRRSVQHRIARHCADAGGEYQRVCNGIGPLAIPSPPVAADDRADWLSRLTAPQRHYVATYCADDRADAELCGGTPIVVAFGRDGAELTAGASVSVPAVTTSWLARDLDGDDVFSPAERYSSASASRRGLTALASLDANHDSKLDAGDPAFSSLLDWAEADRPGALSALEHVAGAKVDVDP